MPTTAIFRKRRPPETTSADQWIAAALELTRMMRPPRIRTLREFAEQEIVLASGPRKGFLFRSTYIPWTAPVLAEMMNPRWRRIFGRGAVQSGKTLIFYVLPTLYHLMERHENVILGAPDIDMAWSKYQEEMLPVIEETRYKELLPRAGSGSRGGKAKMIRFRNGVRIRFMGAGGSDAQRSAYTAPVVVLTEIDKMDRPGEVSREADPIRQFEARTAAYGEAARIYGECTTSIEEGRIYVETTQLGSDTRVHIRCPKCKNWLYPEREQLIHWKEAETVIAAHNAARFLCPHCQAEWTEKTRLKAIEHIRLLHKGQRIEKGKTIGPDPQTYTLGIVWNGMHSPLRPMALIAEEEWRAEQNPLDDSARRALCQFVWARPFKEDIRAPQVTYSLLAQHAADYAFDPLAALPGRDDIPEAPIPEPDRPSFTIGSIDVQKRELYIAIDRFTADPELTRWTLAWAVIEIVPEGVLHDPTESDLRRALDTALNIFRRYGTYSDWVDTGYRHEGALEHVVRTWAAEQGVHALVGRSSGQMARMEGKRLDLSPDVPDFIQARLQPDETVLWFLDVDRLKDEVYFRLFRERGSDGYHHFPRETANEKRTDRSRGPGAVGWIYAHYMRARRDIQWKNGRETRIWDERGRHDLWDCSAYALAGAFCSVAELLEEQRNPATHRPSAPEPSIPYPGNIRTNY